ncbi:MAG: hypothetical protein PHF17_08440 [Arcobacteraceae bacterium]|nr:hypothetical protein [Arcobacteraceae bacterium]
MIKYDVKYKKAIDSLIDKFESANLEIEEDSIELELFYAKFKEELNDCELFFLFLYAFQVENLRDKDREYPKNMPLQERLAREIKNTYEPTEYYEFKDKMQKKWDIFSNIDKTRILLFFPEYILKALSKVYKNHNDNFTFIEKSMYFQIPTKPLLRENDNVELNEIERLNYAYAMCIKIQYLLSTKDGIDGLNVWALANEFVNDYLNIPLEYYQPAFWSVKTTKRINSQNNTKFKMMNKSIETIDDFIKLMQKEILAFALKSIFKIPLDSPNTVAYFDYIQFNNDNFQDTTTNKKACLSLQKTANHIFKYLDVNEHIKNIWLRQERVYCYSNGLDSNNLKFPSREEL